MGYDKNVVSRLAVEKLNCLYDLAQTLGRPEELPGALPKALDLLSRRLGVKRGGLSLKNPLGQIEVAAAQGRPRGGEAEDRHKLGDDLARKVIAAGRPMAVGQKFESPIILDKNKLSFGFDGPVLLLGAPLKSQDETIGALWVETPGLEAEALAEEAAFLNLAAALIAQSVAQIEALRLDEENRRLKSQLATRFSAANLIGHSAAMFEVYALIDKVARSRTTVLIRGESGTGKGLVASAIHYASPRAKGPFIKVNCGALPSSLIEAELFGHEKGAFTGAVAAKPGKFELAQGGSIFLDEIGSLSPEAQSKLLRILQEKEVERLGGTRTVSVDVRVIAATNRNLEAALSQGHFREDLYYRFNVFPIHLPPLRERKTDVLLLVDHFIEKYTQELDRDVRKVSREAIDILLSYDWPGNVRELENCIERAVLLTEDRTIRPQHLPPSLQAVRPQVEPRPLPEAVAELERKLIAAALRAARGNLARAARMLGITPRMIGYKVRKHGLDPGFFAS